MVGHCGAERQACPSFKVALCLIVLICSLSPNSNCRAQKTPRQLWKKKGLRITNSGNSSFLHHFSQEQLRSEHVLAQDTNTNYFFITHGLCDCFPTCKPNIHGELELRSYTAVSWLSPRHRHLALGEVQRRADVATKYLLVISHLQFTEGGNLVCEFLGSKEPHSGGTLARLWPTTGTPSPFLPVRSQARPIIRVTTALYLLPHLHDGDLFTPPCFNYLSLIWDNINSAILSSWLTVDLRKKSSTYTFWGLPSKRWDWEVSCTKDHLDFISGLVWLPPYTHHLLCCITAWRLGFIVKEGDEVLCLQPSNTHHTACIRRPVKLSRRSLFFWRFC